MSKKFIITICLMLTIIMTACSPTEDNPQTSGYPTDAVDQGSETMIVEDMKGDVEIPSNPERIVDVSGSADELIILEMPFIASANTSMFDGVTVPDHLQEYFAENKVETVGNYSGASGDLNLEKIAELKPDLIIMNIRHEKVYEQLKAIAPTVMLSDDMSLSTGEGVFSSWENG